MTALHAALAELIWRTSREDEGTISATGANHVASAIIASGLIAAHSAPGAGEVRLSEAEREALTCDCGVMEDDPTWPETFCPFHADRPTLEVSGSADALIAIVERTIAARLAEVTQPAGETRVEWGGGCKCWVVPESMWTTHYGAVEPGSQVEFNPDCPEHGSRSEEVAGDE